MKKEAALVGFVLCVLAGFAAGMLVRWPSAPVAPGSDGKLTRPVKGTGSALIRIFEVSDFQ